MNCIECNQSIPPGRLEALPDTKYCLKCSELYNTEAVDIEYVTSKSSGSGRNGFAPKD